MKGAPVFFGPDFDIAEQIKAQDAGWKNLARTAGGFLNAAFPGHRTEVANLESAFITLMCAGTERQLEAIARQKAFVPDPRFMPPSAEEQLIELTEQRDRVASQIEAVERGLKDLPAGVHDMIQATALVPLQDQLKSIEERISNVQAAMEFAPDKETL